MAAETMTFKLDGDDIDYEVPEIDDLDLDEWQILYEYAGLTLDDFSPPLTDDDGNVVDEDAETERQRRLNQPAFTKALLHIGYQRAHPELKPTQIRGTVGKAKLLNILEQQLDQLRAANKDGDEEIPPASTSEPEKSSPESSLESDEKKNTNNESSSQVSTNGSAEPDDHHASTTTGESDRFSASAPATSAG